VTVALRADEPLIVLSRHAGPGDTILLIDQLLSRFDRRPSVVLKEAVLAEPCVDLLAHRLPHAVLDTSEREESKALIEELARRLGARGVLLLFPEGANFTPELRRSAVARLRRKGRIRAAAKADRLSHVMPPHPAGALAALRGRPSADLIFAAHTGLGLAVRPRDLWKNMPIGRTLHTRMWLVRSTAIPSDPEAQTNWLEDWWARIDSWIDNQHSRHCSREASNV
jgi:1-acyl-sn-glycerol-3-phosphate acyltransferase